MIRRSRQLKRSPHRKRNRPILIIAFVALSVAACPELRRRAALAAATFARPPRPASPKSPASPVAGKKTPQQDLQQLQARAWAALYTGKLAEAAKLAKPLLKTRVESAQLEAKHFRARWCWAGGTKKSRATAKKAWADLARAPKSDANAIRLKIGRALQLAAPGNAASIDRAIALLKTVTPGEVCDTCIAEAGIELARLYIARGKWTEAAAALKAAEDDLNFRPKKYIPGGGGRQALPKVVTRPFLDEINRVRRQLDLAKDAGRGLFEKGEKLRNAGKFAEAIRTFHQLIKKFPSDRYAARANLHIGYCYTAIGSHRTAIAHWRKFIQAAPAGPWRGQAYASLIDLYLGEFHDVINARKYAAAAAEAMPAGLKDNKLDCDASWKAAAFGIHFQSGIVAYVSGDTSFAASHFEKALKAGGRGAAARVGRLLAFARAGRPLIPEKVGPRAAADPVSVALSVGTIYNICGDYGKAARPFQRVAKGERCRPTTVQTSYALFGRGVAYEGTNKPKMARVYYEGSLRRYPPGTWHDETLYRVAMIIQRDAQKLAPKPPAPKKADPRTAKKPVAKASPGLLASARQAPSAAYLEARKAELAYWRMLIKRFPKSPFAEPAMYYSGTIYAAAGKWADAAKQLTDFTAAYPNSPKAGPAHIQIIDISLERLFDLAAARKSATAATIWAAGYKPGATKDTKGAKDANKVPGLRDVLLAGWNRPPGKDQLKHTKYNIYLRAGLVAYLDQEYDQAVAMFKKAGPVRPSEANRALIGPCQFGLHFLMNAARNRKCLSPQKILDACKTVQERTGVLLADMYMEGMRPEKAAKLCQDVRSFKSCSTEVQAYCIMQQGRALMRVDGKENQSLECLKKLQDPRYASCSSTPGGLLRLGVFTYNRTQDPKASMPVYKYLFTRFPDDPAAEKAMLYYCLDATQLGDKNLASTMSNRFFKKYPHNRWKKALETRLKRLQERSKQ